MIQLVLSSAPFDEVPGKIAVATFFEDGRPLRGSTGLIDWRLNGRLSELILQGRIAGHFGEALIMPSQGRLSTDEILIFGLGNKGDLSEKKMEEGFSGLIGKLKGLQSPQVVVSFGDLCHDFMGWRSLLRSFMNSMSSQLSRQEGEVVCAEDPRWIHEAKRRNMDFGPNVEVAYAT